MRQLELDLGPNRSLRIGPSSMRSWGVTAESSKMTTASALLQRRLTPILRSSLRSWLERLAVSLSAVLTDLELAGCSVACT